MSGTIWHFAILQMTHLSIPIFPKIDKGWQMDIIAERNDTRSLVGIVYAWDYCGRNDIYTRTFRNKLINIRNHTRISDSDTRELPIRGSH